MNILLVEPKQPGNKSQHSQFVGLLRIGNWLHHEGHNIQYVIYPAVARFDPDEVWITSMFTYHYRAVWEAVNQYKFLYPNAKVKLGGIYASLCPEHAKQSGADEVFVGQHPQAIDFAPDPTLLPKPAKFAYLFTSYGCNRACTFCATHLLYGKGIRQKPVEKVVDEIEYVYNLGFKEIRFGDDNLLFDSENHINKICEELIRRKIKAVFRVTGGMSAKDFTLDTAILMRDAGFEKVSFSLESISPEVLKKMGRANNVNTDDILRTGEILDQAGFKRGFTDINFIIGLPYQNIENMLETLLFVYENGFWIKPQRLTPIPGTVDFKRMNLDEYDLEDLDYRKFVAPNNGKFTGDDLVELERLSRSLNYGRHYTSNYCWLTSKEKVSQLFRKKITNHEWRKNE